MFGLSIIDYNWKKILLSFSFYIPLKIMWLCPYIPVLSMLFHYENRTNQVQDEVSGLQIVGNYIDTISTIFTSALLGT